MTETSYVCGICGAVLDQYMREEGLGWCHPPSATDDHEAAPVRRADADFVADVCDFCLRPITEDGWCVPVRSFRVGPNNESDGDWAACATCADLVTKGKWSLLVGRAVTAMHSADKSTPRAQVRVAMNLMYDLVRDNQTGPPVPVRTKV